MGKWDNIKRLQSRQNPLVKQAIALQREAFAKKEGLLLVEGVRQLETAIDRCELDKVIFIDNDAGYAIFSGLSDFFGRQEFKDKLFRVEENLFKRISDTKTSQGIIALAKAPHIRDIASLELDTSGRYVILENIRDPGNLGTIIRTVEGLGFSALILLGDCVWPFNSKSLRAAMGSGFYLDIYQSRDIDWLASVFSPLDLIAAELNGVPLASFKGGKHDGFALLLGNEAHGLSEVAKNMVDFSVTIEMQGCAESYNVAISAGILAWQLSKLYSLL